jgi:hypothetical protein
MSVCCRNNHGYDVAKKFRAKFTHVSSSSSSRKILTGTGSCSLSLRQTCSEGKSPNVHASASAAATVVMHTVLTGTAIAALHMRVVLRAAANLSGKHRLS